MILVTRACSAHTVPCVPCARCALRQTSTLASFVKDRPPNEPLCGRLQANLIKEPLDGNLDSRNNLERQIFEEV